MFAWLICQIFHQREGLPTLWINWLNNILFLLINTVKNKHYWMYKQQLYTILFSTNILGNLNIDQTHVYHSVYHPRSVNQKNVETCWPPCMISDTPIIVSSWMGYIPIRFTNQCFWMFEGLFWKMVRFGYGRSKPRMRLNLTMPLVTVAEGSKKPLMVGQKRSSGDSVRRAVWEIRVCLKLEYNCPRKFLFHVEHDYNPLEF